MPYQLAQQQVPTGDLEWPFHIISIARYLCVAEPFVSSAG